MSTSKMRGMLGMYMAMAAMSSQSFGTSSLSSGFEELSMNKNKILSQEELVEIYKKKGLKEFFYDKGSIWAINQKNADRKAKNKNWI